MRRLLVTHVDLRFGGVERQLSYLLRYLSESRSWHADLLLTSKAGEMASLVPAGVDVRETDGFGAPAMRMARCVSSEVGRNDYDAVLAMHPWVAWPTSVGLSSTRARTPFVMSLPGTVVPGRLDPLRRYLCRRADAIHTVSEEGAASVREVYRPNCRVVMIPNAVDVASVRGASGVGSATAAMRAQGFSPVVCTMSRLVAGKGVDTVVRAVAKVRQSRPAGLVVVGDGPDRHRIAALAQGLGLGDAVRLVGFSDRPFEELAGADLFAFGSESEGLPSAVLEAACIGLPIVTTRYLGGFDEFLVDQVSALAVPIGDHDSMAAAIAMLQDEPDRARRLGASAASAAAAYDYTATGRAFVDMLEAVAHPTPGEATSAGIPA